MRDHLRMRAAIVAAIVALALLAVACGDGDESGTPEAGGLDTSTTPTAPGEGSGSASGAARILDADPCALVTAQEAGAALGGDADSITIGSPGEQHSCHWSGPEGGSLMVIVNDLTCDGLIFALDENKLTDEQERIDDIGQGGMLVGEAGAVYIRAKGGCFSITATKRNVALPKATVLQLARTATERVG